MSFEKYYGLVAHRLCMAGCDRLSQEHLTAIKDAVHKVYEGGNSDSKDRISALEAERDELRAEVAKVKDVALSASMDAAELSEELAAARDGSLQAVFDAVVRYRFHPTHTNDDDSVDKLNDVNSCATYYDSSRAASGLRSLAATNGLSTAVLDELWGDQSQKENA